MPIGFSSLALELWLMASAFSPPKTKTAAHRWRPWNLSVLSSIKPEQFPRRLS
jgi:hypothetical protein